MLSTLLVPRAVKELVSLKNFPSTNLAKCILSLLSFHISGGVHAQFTFLPPIRRSVPDILSYFLPGAFSDLPESPDFVFVL